jgi:murein DD-endopeptidase MepM/ murein hydrolase activator NlpD
VLLAHLQRHSVRVAVGDRVDRGAVAGACGNSGNSTEPHLHVQAMDRPGVWLAQGRPLLLDGREPPRNGEVLDVLQLPADDARRSAPIDRGP